MPLPFCAFAISVAPKSHLCEMWLGKNTWLWLKSDEGGGPAGANGGSSLGEPVRAALSKVGSAAPKACWSEKKMSDETHLCFRHQRRQQEQPLPAHQMCISVRGSCLFLNCLSSSPPNICVILPSDSFLGLTSEAETERGRWWRFRWQCGDSG